MTLVLAFIQRERKKKLIKYPEAENIEAECNVLEYLRALDGRDGIKG